MVTFVIYVCAILTPVPIDCREFETKPFENLEACLIEVRRQQPIARVKGNRLMWCDRNLKLDKTEALTRDIFDYLGGEGYWDDSGKQTKEKDKYQYKEI